MVDYSAIVQVVASSHKNVVALLKESLERKMRPESIVAQGCQFAWRLVWR